MKKSLTIAVLLTVAVSAKAAYLDWNVSGASGDVGKNVYMLLSDPGSFANADAIANAAVDSASVAKITSRSWGTNDQVAEVANADAAKSVYFVVVDPADTKSYTIFSAGNLSGSVYDPDNQESSPGTYGSSVSTIASSGTSRDYQVVPEPTTVALLALGLAALGLKRKVA